MNLKIFSFIIKSVFKYSLEASSSLNYSDKNLFEFTWNDAVHSLSTYNGIKPC